MIAMLPTDGWPMVRPECKTEVMARSGPERPTDLGPLLRQVRHSRDWSLREVEERSGLTSGYLSQLERGGVGHPSPTVLRKLGEGYGVSFPVLLQWAGYIEDDQLDLSANQAAALSTIGDPSTEELKVLREVVELLRRRGTASYSPTSFSSDLDLDDVAKREIAGYCRALLLEADAFDRRPTPLAELTRAADLVRGGEITLSAAEQESLRKRIGRGAERRWKALLGALDFRSQTIWVKPELHPKKERFVLSHEIGHAILPVHREMFGWLEDVATVDPYVRSLLEREANQAAAEILFQCDRLTHEADSSPLSLSRICAYADDFGGSIVATSRRIAETSRRDVAVAIAHHGRQGLGPTHLYTSRSFEARYHWRAGRFPKDLVRGELQSATQLLIRREQPFSDAAERPTIVRLESLHTTWAAIVLIVRDSSVRRAVDRLAAARSSN